MGILSTLLGDQTDKDSGFDAREAFASVLIATASSDGHVSREELEHFFAVMRRTELFRGQTVAEYNAMVHKIQSLLNNRERREVLEKAADGLPEALRETVFALAVDVVFSDGAVEQDEMTVLEEIQDVLKISNHFATKAVEVLKIKNQG